MKEKGVRTRLACVTLGKLGATATEAIPAIAELLKDKAYARVAFEALCDFGPDASPLLPQLVKVACDADSNDTETKWPLSRAESIELVLKWMRAQSPTRMADAELLWTLVGSEDSRFVIELLRSSDGRVHALAVNKLVSLGPTEVAGLLRDDDAELRQLAVRTLGTLGPAARIAVPALAAALHDKNWETRSAAAIALGQIGEDARPAVPALRTSESISVGFSRTHHAPP